MTYECVRCGKKTNRIGRWFHTYFEWNWWSVPLWWFTGWPKLYCWQNSSDKETEQ